MITLLPVLFFLSVFAVYLQGLSPSIQLDDTGELVTCALTLGNAHPPGYPWHAMLGKLSILLPVGSPAFRINLLSAACGAAAAFVLWKLLADLAERFRLQTVVVCLTGASAFAFSRTAWGQSSIAEVYALLLVLFACAATALLRAALTRENRTLLVAAYLSGLTLSHHLMGLYLLLPLGWLLWTE